jgi:hypothetical protein
LPDSDNQIHEPAEQQVLIQTLHSLLIPKKVITDSDLIAATRSNLIPSTVRAK